MRRRPGKTPLMTIRVDLHRGGVQPESWGITLYAEECLTHEALAREIDDAFEKVRAKIEEVTT